MIPVVFMPRSWIIPRFVSLISFVIYVCIVYNLYLFRDITNIGQLLVQILLLVKMLFIFVDDLTDLEMEERRVKRKQIKEYNARQQKASEIHEDDPKRDASR